MGSSLTHFLLLGGLLFWWVPGPSKGVRVIDISRMELVAQRALEAQRLGVTRLSVAKQREVDRRVIHDALLFREARRLGLGSDDPIVKQRLLQKLLFLAAHLGEASTLPTDAELRAFYARYQVKADGYPPQPFRP